MFVDDVVLAGVVTVGLMVAFVILDLIAVLYYAR